MDIRGMILKELFKHSCVCSLVSATFPSQCPTQHQLCALCMQNLSPNSTYCPWLLPLWPHSCADADTTKCRLLAYKAVIDVYIDMVKLTLWWCKPQFFISCLVFAMWNCNTAFTCIFFF